VDLLSNSIEKGMSTDINSSSVMETGVKSLLKTAHQCIRARRATAERAELGRSRERGPWQSGGANAKTRWNFLIGVYPVPTVDVDAIDQNYRTFQIATAQDQNVFSWQIF